MRLSRIMHALKYDAVVAEGRTIQVRGVEPAIVDALERTAAAEGLSLSAYLRRELSDTVRRREAWETWWRNRPPSTGGRVTQEEIDDWKSERDAR